MPTDKKTTGSAYVREMLEKNGVKVEEPPAGWDPSQLRVVPESVTVDRKLLEEARGRILMWMYDASGDCRCCGVRGVRPHEPECDAGRVLAGLDKALAR
jgi:hypothetical protein